MPITGLFWFNQDLRVHDHPGLWQMQHVDRLLCVFCVDPQWFRPNDFNAKAMGVQRRTFLQQALQDLQQNLAQKGQMLIIEEQSPSECLADLIERFNVNLVGQTRHAGVYEQRQWQHLQQLFPNVTFVSSEGHTLFEQRDLPFKLNDLPTTFSKFRKQVERLPYNRPMTVSGDLPPPPQPFSVKIPDCERVDNAEFTGGETAGLAQLKSYFESELPQSYKTVRNQLSGWQNSTKFSAWLAQGSLSVRRCLAELRRYEAEKGANESTYWIFFELLWREYFHWYAFRYGTKLFRFNGIQPKNTRRCYYAERYQKWCHGNTPYPLVNACMKQLNATGYLSNRGRQIAASCFIYDLNLDWRFGAAYFEQQLIDYDVASNWGNWQYIAGVGADPRGGRHFNIDKQTRLYDPQGLFIEQWQGQTDNLMLDSVDAADWPIMPPPKK